MTRRHHARGMALVEAMVAATLLAAGVLGAARLSLHAQASAREAHARAHAQTLAGQALDCALANRSPCPAVPSSVLAGQRYTVTLERHASQPELLDLQATVEWVSDGPGNSTAPQRLRWQTRLSSLPDAGGSALGLSLP